MQSRLIGWEATMGEVADNGAASRQPAVPGPVAGPHAQQHQRLQQPVNGC
jgi:hypothetical protein